MSNKCTCSYIRYEKKQYLIKHNIPFEEDTLEHIFDEYRAHLFTNSILGELEFIPKTREERTQLKEEEEQEKIKKEQQKIEELNNKKQYLIDHNIEFNENNILELYKKTVYANMTPEEQKNKLRDYAVNYNIIRILEGLEPLAYKN